MPEFDVCLQDRPIKGRLSIKHQLHIMTAEVSKKRILNVKTDSSLLLLFGCSVLSDSLWPHGLQHAKLPCLPPCPGACSNSCPLSRWCHPTISSSVIPLLLLPSICPSIRVFSSESALHIRWPDYWSFSFSISLSNEYSVLISFRIDWFDLLSVQGTLKNLFQHYSSLLRLTIT